MLTFSNITFGYPNQPLFSELNFSMEPGEFVFLIGKSGAGKSTLIQMIYINLFPHSGTVQVGPYNSITIKKKELPFLRRKLGVIFQDFKLLTDRNVYDNLAFVLDVTGTPGREIKKRVYNALSAVGLSHKQKNMPNELSGGEQQRIAIARAIINEPMLVLADEPTGNLDPETSLEILEILKKINSRGTSVLFATHNYELVRKHNARIVKLDNGKALKVILKQPQKS
ncbi:MAG: cell division ATP-binding protein FtsE [Ignavibacteriales bacterium]|nr:cell division ATP-binding protein FtsE [Ignavibacteriales bacterium]